MRGFARSASSCSAWVLGSFAIPAAARSFFFQVPGSCAVGAGGTLAAGGVAVLALS